MGIADDSVISIIIVKYGHHLNIDVGHLCIIERVTVQGPILEVLQIQMLKFSIGISNRQNVTFLDNSTFDYLILHKRLVRDETFTFFLITLLILVLEY